MKRSRHASLHDLPHNVLTLIVRHALSLSPHGELTPSASTQKAIIALCRISSRLRFATASAIRAVRFGSAKGFWPGASALSPHAWNGLEELDLTLDRAGMLGFLKWLLPATSLTTLRLRVVGAPYANDGLARLERMLLGRLFTQVGVGLQVLEVRGVETQAVLFGALFQCTRLRELRIETYGSSSAGTLLNVFVLLCIVNRERLECVEGPLKKWAAEEVDGRRLYAGCQVTWGTLWGSYRAGLKESAVNLGTDEGELVEKFRKVSVRMDALEEAMGKRLREFGEVASGWGKEDVPERVLFGLLPKLRWINETERNA